MRQRKVQGLVLGFFCLQLLLYCFWTLTSVTSPARSELTSFTLYFSLPFPGSSQPSQIPPGWWLAGRLPGPPRTSGIQGAQVHPDWWNYAGVSRWGCRVGADCLGGRVLFSISLGGLAAAAPVGWSIPSLIAPRNCTGKVGGILNFGNQIAAVVAPIATGFFAEN